MALALLVPSFLFLSQRLLILKFFLQGQSSSGQSAKAQRLPSARSAAGAESSDGSNPDDNSQRGSSRQLAVGRALRAIFNFRFDLIILGSGSVSFFDRVGFAHVFAIFCFAVKPGPLLVINVRVRANPHHPWPSGRCGRWARRCWTGCGSFPFALFRWRRRGSRRLGGRRRCRR